tara:strand:+ start:4897 stop:5196 length:300 start_codon:yes stop_codon:yes gene_type:complete
MIKETHVGLVIMNLDNTELLEARYICSKFERELGSYMTIDSKKYRVGIIGDTRNAVISELNQIIKAKNKIVRREQKIENRKADLMFNKVLAEAVNMINS